MGMSRDWCVVIWKLFIMFVLIYLFQNVNAHLGGQRCRIASSTAATIQLKLLVRAKCVRQRLALHRLVENVVASINSVISLFLPLTFLIFLLNLRC